MRASLRALGIAAVAGLLAACSGAAGGSQAPVPRAVSSRTAEVIVRIDAPNSRTSVSRNSARRRPAYVSPATENAAVSTGTSSQAALGSLTCTGSPSTCSNASPFTVAIGSTSFNAEVDDGTAMLAEGRATQTIVGGDNTVNLTLNGVAATAAFSSSAFSVAVGDADGNAIHHAGSDTTSTFDDGPIAFSSSDSSVATAVFSGSNGTISNGKLTAPDAAGTDYQYTVTCAGSGSAVLTLVTGADSPVYDLGALAYPSADSTLLGADASVTVTCTGAGSTATIASTGAVNVVIFLTSGTTWTVPSNWNSASNEIEAIGGGGGGEGSGYYDGGGGGGGGGYSAASNVSLTAGSTVAIQVGAGGSGGLASDEGNGGTGGDTFLCNSMSNCSSITGSAVVVGAHGGSGGGTSGYWTGGAGGAGTLFSGGNGGGGGGSPYSGGGGGGGAAGPNGNGGAAGDGNGGGGGGGGGNGGGAAGASSTSGAGASGGSSSTNGAGGNGGNLGNSADATNGGNGTDFDSLHGSGGGGGGGGCCEGFNGGNGGAYGGGGGGAGGGGNSPVGGAGTGGIIVIVYAPL